MFIGRSYGGKFATSWPLSKMRPDVGFSNPASMRNRVDLPHPELPNNANISPWAIFRETSSTAVASSKRLTSLSVTR